MSWAEIKEETVRLQIFIFLIFTLNCMLLVGVEDAGAQVPKSKFRYELKEAESCGDSCQISGIICGKRLLGWKRLEEATVKIFIEGAYYDKCTSNKFGQYHMKFDTSLIKADFAIEFSHPRYMTKMIEGVKPHGYEIDFWLKGRPKFIRVKM